MRRQLARLIRSRSVVFRCEVAQLRTEPRVRPCLSLTGPANFLVTMWTASLPDLMAVQTWLLGWMLHPDGRCTDEVVPLAMVR